MATTDVSTLADIKTLLGITDADRDALLAMLITSATSRMEQRCAAKFVRRELTEKRQGSRFRLGNFSLIPEHPVKKWRLYRPITSVASILDPYGNEIEATYYSLMKETGELIYQNGYFPMAVDANGLAAEWTITFTAGWFADTAAVDLQIKEAASMLIAGRLTRKGHSISSKNVMGTTMAWTSSEGDFPPEVMELLAPWLEVEI